jgi:hypothetical protein
MALLELWWRPAAAEDGAGNLACSRGEKLTPNWRKECYDSANSMSVKQRSLEPVLQALKEAAMWMTVTARA